MRDHLIRFNKKLMIIDKIEYPDSWWRNNTPWEQWFAWHPVRVHGKLTWLKTVYRKHIWSKSDTFNQYYEYGTILDVLGEKHD